MGSSEDQIRMLEERISELEAKIRTLRRGRRVLLNLLQQFTYQHNKEVNRLRMELYRLKLRNSRYARQLLAQRLTSQTK